MTYTIIALEGGLWAVQRIDKELKATTVAIYPHRMQADALRAVLSVELDAWRREDKI